MALQKQIFELPMTGPLDESVRPETGDPAAFSEVLNFVQDKRGAYSKRRGSTVFTRQTMAATNITAARKVAMMNERSPVVIDNSNLYAYSDQADRWADRGRVPGMEVTRKPGIQPGRDWNPIHNVAGYQGYRLVTFSSFDPGTTNSYLNAAVIDSDTGAFVSSSQELATNTSISAVIHWAFCIGAKAIVVYSTDVGTPGTYARILDLTSPATITAGWGSPVTISTTRVSMSACANSTRFFVATANLGVDLRVDYYDTSASFVASTPAIAVAASGAIVAADSTTVWLGHITNLAAAFNVIAYDSSAAVKGTTIALITRPFFGLTGVGSIVPTTADTCVVVSSQLASSGGNSHICIRGATITAGAVTAVGSQQDVYRVAAASAGFRLDSRVYLNVAIPGIVTFSTTPAALFTVDITDRGTTLPVVSTPAPRLLGLGTLGFSGENATYVSGYTAEFAMPVQKSSTATAALELVTLDAASPYRWQSATIAESLHMSGGVASVYDGSRVAEQNFLIPPEIGTIASGTAGALTGTYLYSAIYEHVDAAGNIHWSEPAVSKSSGAVVAKRIDVPVATLPVTMRESITDGTNPVRIVLLRSITLGSTLYRHSAKNNTTASVTVTFNDNTSDAVLTANPLAYTQPGQPGAALPRRAPPSLTCLIQHNDGLAALAEDGHTIWFSGAHIPGEGIWWNPLMTAVVEDESRLVGLASFDGRLYAFTRRSVWVIDGSGFTDNGAGGYSLPRRLAVEAGCIEPRSIVVCGVGALFQSDLGIMLLSRSGEVTWFGEVVRDTLAEYPIITSAVCDSTRSEVRFSCVAGEDETGATGEGAWIKWDYSINRWTVGRTYAQQIGDPEGLSYPTQSQAIGVVNDEQVIVWCKPDGYVFRSNDADWLDETGGGSEAPGIGVLQTNWVHLAGLQGFQRLWRVLILLRRYTDHQVDLTAWFDYDDSNSAYTETWSFTAAEIAAMPREQLELRIKKQRCQAIKIKLRMSDNGTTGTGQQAEVYGFRYEFGTLPKTTLSTAHR